MVTIELDGEEAAVLKYVLESDVSDLGMEIAGTDRFEFRQTLKARKATLLRVVDSLAAQLA